MQRRTWSRVAYDVLAIPATASFIVGLAIVAIISLLEKERHDR